MSALVSEVSVGKLRFPVYVNSDGIFSAKINDSDLSDKTLAGITKKIKKMCTATLHVDFCQLVSDRHDGADTYVRRGFVYGIHGSNRNMLVEFENGEKEQFWRTGSTMRPLTPDEETELLKLEKVSREAEAKLEAFQDKYSLSLMEAVNKQLEQEETT